MRRWLLVHSRDDRHVVAPLSEVARQVEHHGANPPQRGGYSPETMAMCMEAPRRTTI